MKVARPKKKKKAVINWVELIAQLIIGIILIIIDKMLSR